MLKKENNLLKIMKNEIETSYYSLIDLPHFHVLLVFNYGNEDI